MLLISGNIKKCFVVSSRSPGRTLLITHSKSSVVDYNIVVLLILSPKLLQDSRAFSSVLLELLDDVDLFEMLIFGNIEKHFVVS
ncbi:hypothetical protein H5410_056365, partial [Solanum commersonii]